MPAAAAYNQLMWRSIRDRLTGIGRAACFMGDILACVATGRVRWGEVLRQVHVQGIGTLGIVMLTSFASGAVLAMQGQVTMERMGAKEAIAQLVALSLVRELSPVFTALVFSGKAGAGMAAELGTMSVNNQIQATRVMGVDPVEFLVVPRVLACIMVLPVLVVVSELVGIWGGYAVAVTQADIPGSFYLSQTFQAVGYTDFFSGFIKMFVFATLIGWIASYKGFYTEGGSLGVGRFTTEAVAACYIAILVSNTVVTKLVMTLWGS
jgi:phospholipid/cholesterol/gamma-HCH transport system permease protein